MELRSYVVAVNKNIVISGAPGYNVPGVSIITTNYNFNDNYLRG